VLRAAVGRHILLLCKDRPLLHRLRDLLPGTPDLPPTRRLRRLTGGVGGARRGWACGRARGRRHARRSAVRERRRPDMTGLHTPWRASRSAGTATMQAMRDDRGGIGTVLREVERTERAGRRGGGVRLTPGTSSAGGSRRQA
jgi:hypothetical protein